MTRLGVVFSSGFFVFFANAGFLAALRDRGFLAALRDRGIEPAGYAGASSGTIIAAMAATRMHDNEIKEMLFGLRKEDFWDPDPWHFILRKALLLFKGYTGYLKGEGFGRLLGKIPVERIEDCPLPLIITATNLTQKRETILTRGNLKEAIQASGVVPMLFKPVEIDGSLYVDGGMVNKAPVQAVADLIRPEKIIVHFISSENLEDRENSFLKMRLTPWHVFHLAVNISRQEAYQKQCDIVNQRGIEIIEVKTDAPTLGPNSLEKGPMVYDKAREAAVNTLSKEGF
jgi:NTE family protein